MIVYLHGFISGGTSAKAAWLRRHLPDILVLSPTYPAHLATEAPQCLREYIATARREHRQDEKLLLIGSSMGGFWSRYLAAELSAGMVLINPATRPDVGLMDLVGVNKNEATGEEFVLTAEQVKALAAYVRPTCDRNVPTLVLLDEADEVIDYRQAQAFYRDCGKVIVYPGGSHRFDHLAEALPEIRQIYERL
jgi:predicted esterase YcpF (UPF0227 family)